MRHVKKSNKQNTVALETDHIIEVMFGAVLLMLKRIRYMIGGEDCLENVV